MSAALIQLERLLEVGRVREAEQLLRQALSENPADAELRVYAARIALEREDPQEARAQIAQALTAEPHHFGARILLFHLEMQDKHYREAEELIISLVRDNPASAGLLALYGRLMLLTFHFDKARALVDEALRGDPDDDTARLTDVLLSTVEGNRGRADVQLGELVADDPDGRAVAWMLLLSLTERGRNREALAVAQQLLRVTPDDKHLLDVIVSLRTQTHWLALPLVPTAKLGWAGAAAMWAGAVVVLGMLRRSYNPWTAAVAGAYIAWVIYTWAYPPLMERWVRARGL